MENYSEIYMLYLIFFNLILSKMYVMQHLLDIRRVSFLPAIMLPPSLCRTLEKHQLEDAKQRDHGGQFQGNNNIMSFKLKDIVLPLYSSTGV